MSSSSNNATFLVALTLFSTIIFTTYNEKLSITNTITTNQRTNHDSPPPTTTCLQKDGPTPVILLSLGRSGSGSTWQIMSSLTTNNNTTENGTIARAEELTGSSIIDSINFFRNIEQSSSSSSSSWVLDSLCKKQQETPNASIVGFKWKPFFPSIFSRGALDGLRIIAKSKNNNNVMIKVVRSRRNPLDVMISILKHESERFVPAHCEKGDNKCLGRHSKFGTHMELPTSTLIDQLKEQTKREDDVDDLLANMGVPHVSVSYERLYQRDDAEEWMRIFRFLEKGPSKGLSMEDVRGVMAFATTTSPQRIALSNFDEVEALLRGTEFEGLLDERYR